MAHGPPRFDRERSELLNANSGWKPEFGFDTRERGFASIHSTQPIPLPLYSLPN